ncbi:MAG: hypothetical protein GF363_14330 [Chitinivibrionales bacterium]|nr:hypothetical protein [Chitinivibrionales bacterium]
MRRQRSAPTEGRKRSFVLGRPINRVQIIVSSILVDAQVFTVEESDS